MELFNETSKAYQCAMRRFLRQKANEPVYIYRTSIARREMWAVLSAAEIKANKISAKNCWTAIDGQYGLTESKEQLHQFKGEIAELRLQVTAIKGYRQYVRATEKLEQMGRNAEGVKTASEVTSDSSQRPI